MSAEPVSPATYVGLFETGADGTVSVFFPDVPGCASAGGTLSEAQRNAMEALSLHLEDEAAPTARAMEDILADPEVRRDISEGCLPIGVPFLRPLGRSVRVNLSVDEGHLRVIDEAARARGVTRSAFLAAAALARIEAEGK